MPETLESEEQNKAVLLEQKGSWRGYCEAREGMLREDGADDRDVVRCCFNGSC